MIGKSLLDKAVKYRSWVDPARFSDHNPIFLKLEMSGNEPAKPFKFNHGWLKFEGFKELICEVWRDDDNRQNLPPMENLMAKLSRLKQEVKKWIKSRNLSNKATLLRIEQEIGKLNELTNPS